MSLSKDQWYQRLKSWVPGWLFTDGDSEVTDAVFYAMAKLLATMEEERAELLAFTFIDTATNPYLELHGDERGVDRLPGESDTLYRQRIKTRNISSKSSLPEIDLIAQEAMTVKVVVREDFAWGVFCDAGSYLNCGDILFDWIENGGFSVVVNQGADPDEVDAMIASINRNKAFGVLYRVVERFTDSLALEDGSPLLTEDGDPLELE